MAPTVISRPDGTRTHTSAWIWPPLGRAAAEVEPYVRGDGTRSGASCSLSGSFGSERRRDGYLDRRHNPAAGELGRRPPSDAPAPVARERSLELDRQQAAQASTMTAMSEPGENTNRKVVRLEIRRVERRVPGLGMGVFRAPSVGDEMRLAPFYDAEAPNHRAFVNETVATTLESPVVDAADVDTWTERARAIARVAVAEAAGCTREYRRLAGSGFSGDERLYRAMRTRHKRQLEHLQRTMAAASETSSAWSNGPARRCGSQAFLALSSTISARCSASSRRTPAPSGRRTSSRSSG
jgi:hypothetical protein